MPIVDVEIVCDTAAVNCIVSARALADALGQALGCRPGQNWVRLRRLEEHAYAENEVELNAAELPVFVTVQHAQLPGGPALLAEVAAVTQAVAQCVARPPERVHVQYAAPGAGRQAFGGRLVN